MMNRTLIITLIVFMLLLAACGELSSDSEREETRQVESGEPISSDSALPQDPGETPEDEESVEVSERETSSTAVASGDSTQDGAETEPQPTPTESFAGDVPAPDFPDGLDWLNTSRPLTLADLRGKVVLLDFWTYGCINCIHIIPELKDLEEKYADELVVIGVHSAKFENEAETENIRRIIERYELEHPVVNDKEFQIWSQYGARAWPTLVIIDPDGNVLGYHAGEGIYQPFDYIIGNMISQFDALGRIDRTPLETILLNDDRFDSPLLFPGKVLADSENNLLYIADSNHNRIVITDLEGTVVEVIGNGKPDLEDGSYETSSFFRPQGLALDDNNRLYVADTENHAIRQVDLSQKTVKTLAGTGEQKYIRTSEIDGRSSPLNSPWDVLYLDGVLYIAMAGQHQIWGLDPDSGSSWVHAGSGREELKDGPVVQGGLNQPSGLSTDGEVIYFADSEASAIRVADSDPDGDLRTIVGTGLFDFGDVDGVGDSVRLQHPLGIVYHAGLLYVADTYNSKIKIVDPGSRESVTLAGGDESGWRDGSEALFDEPGGLSYGDGLLYIADTNNHAIRILDLDTGVTSTLVLIDTDGQLTRQPEGEEYNGKVLDLDTQSVKAGPGTLLLDVYLPDGYKVNDLTPFLVEWSVDGEAIVLDEDRRSHSAIEPAFPISFPVEFSEGEGVLTGELTVYFCESESQSLCLIERVRLNAPVKVVEDGDSSLLIEHTIADLPS